ncbi:hypothetical protein QCA50_011510 [Cerrena zonata]|uniref:C2H2-type domain-containing protein n=1 Tax=Cerrena zonata TaxID=2478898 RepID=A0AAW0FY98_9APHY
MPRGIAHRCHKGKDLVCPKCDRHFRKNEEAKNHIIEEFPELADGGWLEFFHHCERPCKYYSIQRANYQAHRKNHHAGRDKYASDSSGTASLMSSPDIPHGSPDTFATQGHIPTPPLVPDMSTFVNSGNSNLACGIEHDTYFPYAPPQANLLGLDVGDRLGPLPMGLSGVGQSVGMYGETYISPDFTDVNAPFSTINAFAQHGCLYHPPEAFVSRGEPRDVGTGDGYVDTQDGPGTTTTHQPVAFEDDGLKPLDDFDSYLATIQPNVEFAFEDAVGFLGTRTTAYNERPLTHNGYNQEYSVANDYSQDLSPFSDVHADDPDYPDSFLWDYFRRLEIGNWPD